jgi:hypothetical protein
LNPAPNWPCSAVQVTGATLVRACSRYKPDVDIEGQRPRADRPDGFLTDWDRVLPQRAPEPVIQANPVLPQRPLAFVGRSGEGDRVLHEGTVLAQLGAGDFGQEGRPKFRIREKSGHKPRRSES